MARLMVISVALLLLPGLPALVDAHHPELTDYDGLQATAAQWVGRGVEVHVPEISDEGRDIIFVKLGTGPFHILYLNALHADEPASVEAFVRFVWALLGQLDPTFTGPVLPGVTMDAPGYQALADPVVREELLSRVTIMGFPMMDPDGIENAHESDRRSNTDYATKVTPQSRAIDWAVRTYHPDLFVDSHGAGLESDIDIWIGLVDPAGVDEDVLAESRRVADVAWRSASAADARVGYFEEHLFRLAFGLEGDPFATVDEAYWASAARVAPVTQESYQLLGIPAIYTEATLRKSRDYVQTVTEGASAQQLVLVGLALEASGLLTGEVPDRLHGADTFVLVDGATRFTARVSWNLPGQDYVLVLRDDDGHELARADPDPTRPIVSSKVLVAQGLPAGTYSLVATPLVPGAPDGMELHATWRSVDPSPRAMPPVLDPHADVRLCLDQESAYQQVVGTLDPRLTTPRC